jgi:hypothetical protein
MERIIGRLSRQERGVQIWQLGTDTIRSVATGVVGVAFIQALLILDSRGALRQRTQAGIVGGWCELADADHSGWRPGRHRLVGRRAAWDGLATK